jgi:CRISPR-associated exonuclease Cas4
MSQSVSTDDQREQPQFEQPRDEMFESSCLQTEDIHVTGTLVWYYCICPRQAWLMAHQINPDEDDPNIEYGRFLQRFSYSRERKEGVVGSSKIDIHKPASGRMVVAEVKKSSRFLRSATMQTLFYLKQLKERGIDAVGEIRIPDEKKRIPVVLTDEALQEMQQLEAELLTTIQKEMPEPPKKTGWCRNCAYREFCWS